MTKNASEAASASASPPCRGRSKKPNLRGSKAHSPGPMHFSSKTPEKPPQRIRNRGIALSLAEIRRVGKGLHDGKQQRTETTSSQVKSSVRRQISLWPSSPSKPKVTADENKLPQKYEMLGEFFHHLDSLISIFRLKGWTPSFKKISSRIESLSDRSFTLCHLAQLKFMLPEAILLEKILVLDERTSCMVADIRISIDPNAVESDERVPLRELFWKRLRGFWESHPEGDEIPEGTLPEPFNRPTKDSLLDKLKTSLPTKMSSCMASVELPNEHLAAASHLPPSFRPRFAQKFKLNGADDVNQKCPMDSMQPVASPVSESSLKDSPPFEDTNSCMETSPTKLPSEAASTERCPTICASLELSGAPPATPIKTIENAENKDGSLKSTDAMSTPAKLVSTPIRLMSATPALRPSKIHYMSPDDNTTSLNKLARRPPRSRSLKFDTPMKNKEAVYEDNAGDLPVVDDVFDILSENLIQSIRERERMAMEERDPAISQAKKRTKNIASLPKLFDMIRSLLRQRSCITKSELVNKIITGRRDIVDRSEVEEQLSLLLELVPEWISEKLVSSGDLIYVINKLSSPETIRASLEAAK
ncbi:CDT1-like protein a, chloroplastic [Cajanus cajan]|uniref:CDT1-like protein a, chloroplastic n=1 Tax=Cajanus cajan TaxID=3821 RepID=UPI00098DA817|nr:CDT1-like protein a, chloroplastic [Cajanus cajan]